MELSTPNLVALRGIAETLNRSVDLHQALHNALIEVVKLLNLRGGWIFLFNEKENSYDLAAHHKLPPALAPTSSIWKGGCQCNSQGRSGMLKGACNMVRCSRIEGVEGDAGGISYHASVPLDTPHGHIGILNIASESGDLFPEDQLQLLMNVGNQMAIAIERATLFEHIRARRLREHQSFLKISNLMVSGRSFASVLQEIAHLSADMFAASASLLVVDECRQDHPLKACRLAFHGFPEEIGEAELRTFLDSCTNRALRCKTVDGPRLITPRDRGLTMCTLLADEDVVCATLPQTEMETALTRLTGLTDVPFFAVPIRSISLAENLGMLYVAQGGLENSREDAYLLSLLANQVALAVEMARLEAVRTQSQNIEHELAMARDIQVGFLPESVPELAGYQLAVRYEAAHQVSGDFYDFLPLPDGRLGLVVADVAGKGMPAALIMALCRTLLRAMVDEETTPLEAVLKTNHFLVEQNRTDKFVSLFYGVLDPASGVFDYVRAGHNHPMHYHCERAELNLLTGEGLVLGVIEDPPMKQMRRKLAFGDVVVFFTDGITEAMDGGDVPFGEDRLSEIIRRHHSEEVEVLADTICDQVHRFRGVTPASDDFTLIVLKRCIIAT